MDLKEYLESKCGSFTQKRGKKGKLKAKKMKLSFKTNPKEAQTKPGKKIEER